MSIDPKSLFQYKLTGKRKQRRRSCANRGFIRKKTYLYTNKMIYAKIRGLYEQRALRTKGYAKNKRGFMRIEGFCEP